MQNVTRAHSDNMSNKYSTITQNHSIISAHSHSDEHNMLPLMKITVSAGKQTRQGVILIDSGSERTFIDAEFLNMENINATPCRIKTVSGQGTLYTREQTISCRLGVNPKVLELNAQIARNFEIEMNNSKLRKILSNMEHHGLSTALDPHLQINWNQMLVCGVLGADNIKLLGDLRLREFDGLHVYQTMYGNMPFGSVKSTQQSGNSLGIESE